MVKFYGSRKLRLSILMPLPFFNLSPVSSSLPNPIIWIWEIPWQLVNKIIHYLFLQLFVDFINPFLFYSILSFLLIFFFYLNIIQTRIVFWVKKYSMCLAHHFYLALSFRKKINTLQFLFQYIFTRFFPNHVHCILISRQ